MKAIRVVLAVHFLTMPSLISGCSSKHIPGSTSTSLSTDTPSPTPDAPTQASITTPDAFGGIPMSFRWNSSGPLISPKSDSTHDVVSIKDPSVVHFDDRWHVYATVANTAGNWGLVYLNFTDWQQADSAPQYFLDTTPSPAIGGYKAAPQVFCFRPQKKWYLIYQAGPPQYSTADDLSEWQTWTPPKNFFTDDNGHLYRSQTARSLHSRKDAISTLDGERPNRIGRACGGDPGPTSYFGPASALWLSSATSGNGLARSCIRSPRSASTGYKDGHGIT